jgi:predicted ester cyclase
MSAEENKAAFRRLPEDVFNSGNLDLVDELVSSDYVEHQPVPPGWPTGLGGFKMFVTTLRSAFPDVHYTVENVLAEGEMAAGHVTARGTHQGESEAFGPPTGNRIDVTGITIERVSEEGKIVEVWTNFDHLGLMQQLGLVREQQ